MDFLYFSLLERVLSMVELSLVLAQVNGNIASMLKSKILPFHILKGATALRMSVS